MMDTTAINGHGKRWGWKEKRGRWARRAVPLAATLLVALPVSAAHGGTRAASGADGAIMLRYQFTPGEQFAYAVTEHSRAEVADPQAGLQTSARVGHFILRYAIQSVSPDGTAAAETSASASTVVLTLNGQSKTYHGVNPPDVEDLGADNSLPGFATDKHSISSLVGRTRAYGVQLFGALPSSPLTPGATFRTSANEDITTLTPVLQGAKLPLARIVARNTFVGYRQDGGVQVAVIDSRATPSYSGNGTIPTLLAGQMFHVTGKGTLHIVSTYDVAHKRLRGSTVDADLTFVVATSDAPDQPVTHFRLVRHFTFQPVQG